MLRFNPQMAKFKAQSPAQIQPQIWGPEPCLDSSHKMAKFEAQRLVQTQPQNGNLKGPEPCLDSAPLSRFSPKMAIAFLAQPLGAPKLPNLRPIEPCPELSARKFSNFGKELLSLNLGRDLSLKVAKFECPEPCPDSGPKVQLQNCQICGPRALAQIQWASKIVKFEAPRGLPKKERGAGWGGLSQNPLRKGCPGSLERGPGAKKKPLRKGQKGLLGEEGRLRKS